MQLFNFRIPETEHLPAPEREAILKRCLASDEMRRYKSTAPRVCGVGTTLIGASFIYLAVGFWKWSFYTILPTGVVVTLVAGGLLAVAKVTFELRLLRKLAGTEARK
jgi:hypothetical protein